MAQAIWKGHISFGLVNVPVALFPAETRDELDFDLLDKRDSSPIGYQKINKSTGKPVSNQDIVRGYEYEKGEYVVVTDKDLQQASPERTQRVDILAFVEAAQIPPAFYDRPYYLAPTAKQEKGYALLREALNRTHKVGVATVVIRTRQYLAALIPQEKLLLLDLLRYPDEIRDAEGLDLPGQNLKALGISPKELEMAERLIDQMTEPWDPGKYANEYKKELLAFIRKKAAKGETETVEAPAPARRAAEVVDIMTLLKRSVDQTETGRRHRKRPGRASVA
jgi:DNA end-binding protein Ku